MRKLLLIGAMLSACGCGGSTSTPTAPSSPPAAANTMTIDVLGERGSRSFSPNPAVASPGTLLVWRNTDNETHHIVFNDGSLDTGDIRAGASSSPIRLAANGANYHCTIHPTMVGSVTSTGEPPPCEGAYCP